MKKCLFLLGLIIVGLSITPAVNAENIEASPTQHRTYLPFLRASQPPVPAPTPAPTPPPPPPPASFADQVIALTNQHRANVGCGPLTKSFQLTSATQKHVTDMASNDFFSHTGSDGSTPQMRAMTTGYFGPIAENIAAGMATPEDVVNTWLNSPGHRVNMLNCSYNAIGMAYTYDVHDTFGPYRHYWTQMFGTN